jgi:hypothetical protein
MNISILVNMVSRLKDRLLNNITGRTRNNFCLLQKNPALRTQSSATFTQQTKINMNELKSPFFCSFRASKICSS